MSDDYDDDETEGFDFSGKIWTLLLVGTILVCVVVALLIVASIWSGGSVGGVVFLGPIPIAFGSGPDLQWLIPLSVLISIISVVAFAVFYWRSKREEN